MPDHPLIDAAIWLSCWPRNRQEGIDLATLLPDVLDATVPPRRIWAALKENLKSEWHFTDAEVVSRRSELFKTVPTNIEDICKQLS